MKFSVGDRVACYWNDGTPVRSIGVVANVSISTITVSMDSDADYYDQGQKCDWHPKQCRKLVKKKRREIWVCCIEGGKITGNKNDDIYNRVVITKPQNADGWIRFIEAKKQ